MTKYLYIICVNSLLFLNSISAQYYNTGQDPGSLKWMQIKTEQFTVIYPETYGDAATGFTRTLNNALTKLTTLYPEKKLRMPVIIHNHTTSSNGYVAWAPSRIEIYPTPEQNSIPLDANTQLAIHELTHVFQLKSLERGFTKALSFITGQQLTGAVSSMLPLWFLEGDAVFSESVLTGSGRGRSPSFQKQLKALMIEQGDVYKYDKSVNGSFRNYVPDHYQYGYQMIAWSNSKYDPAIWKKALGFTASAPFTLNPVNLSLRRSASLTKKRLFNEAFDTLKTLWMSDHLKTKAETYQVLNPAKGNEYVSYHSPVLAGKDSIITVRTSLSFPPSFVLIRPSEKTEERIHIPGYIYPYFISSGGGKLCWVEIHSDPRWANRTWSVIKLMDINKKKVKQLTRKTRYMAASISPDGNQIAAVENTADNVNRLVIMDAWNGFILESVPAPGNSSLQRPQWDDSGRLVTVIFLTDMGEGIMSYSIKDKAWNTIIDPGRNDIQSSFIRNDSLFFISSYSGTDNIYLRTPDKSIVPVTNSKFGVSDLCLNGFLLLFSDYTSKGSNVCYTTLPSSPFEGSIHKSESSYLINRFEGTDKPANDDTYSAYAPVPYRKFQNLFRFHSWMPFYADIETIQDDPLAIKPGFTIMSQNNLSTLISSFGYEYSGQRHKFHSRINWLGWYLAFETRLDYGDPPSIQKFNEDITDPVDIANGIDLTNEVSLPLYFRNGRFSKFLYLSAASTYSNDNIYIKEKGVWDKGQTGFTGRFYFSNYHRSAHRDIYPRWAQLLDVSYSFYPFDAEIYGDILSARTAFYFPGLLRNNGLRIRLEAEKQNPEKFILSNRVDFSRSYDNIISGEIQFGSIDYVMPLAYPDFNISSILYLTRIRSALFYDFTRGSGNYIFSGGDGGNAIEYHDYSETFRSFGIQLLGDFYLFRIPFMITSGLEASWRNPGEYPFLKLIFNIDIYGMNISRRNRL